MVLMIIIYTLFNNASSLFQSTFVCVFQFIRKSLYDNCNNLPLSYHTCIINNYYQIKHCFLLISINDYVL